MENLDISASKKISVSGNNSSESEHDLFSKTKAYYQKNKEYRIEYGKLYYQQHKERLKKERLDKIEKLRQDAKDYYHSHKDTLKEYKINYYNKNKQKFKDYYDAHKAEIIERSKKYLEKRKTKKKCEFCNKDITGYTMKRHQENLRCKQFQMIEALKNIIARY